MWLSVKTSLDDFIMRNEFTMRQSIIMDSIFVSFSHSIKQIFVKLISFWIPCFPLTLFRFIWFGSCSSSFDCYFPNFFFFVRFFFVAVELVFTLNTSIQHICNVFECHFRSACQPAHRFEWQQKQFLSGQDNGERHKRVSNNKQNTNYNCLC